VAHEIGHQFGGNHSFNNECGGNRNNDTAYETGSGTTIMAYAGVCDPNVEFHSDAQFHAQSITEMSAFITGNGNCSVNTIIANTPPVANAGPDHTIPFGTPFILSGSATDVNGDTLTYCWEEMDKEISVQPPVSSATEGPNFKSIPIKEVPQRFLPRIEDVLDNNLFPTWEVISNVAREFNFALSVRDNNILGGQVTIDYMKVNVSGTAGPFVVTSPNTNTTWQAGTNQTVTWNVAGTTANGVNTPYVDIFLSTDGGFTYPTVLGAKVPNDGSEIVTIPNIPGTTNRIMVKGYDNIFYDISNTAFSITAPATTMAFAVNGAQNITACKGNNVVYSLNYKAYSGFNSATTFTVTGNPTGSVVTFSPASISANGVVTATVSNTTGAAAGFYTITVTATSGSVTKTFHLYLNLLDSGFGPVVQLYPANGATTVPLQVTFDWEDTANAGSYQFELADDAAFTNIVDQVIVTESSYATNLGESFTYYWRVSPANEGCTGSASAVYSFTTGYNLCVDYVSTDVPVLISATDVATITSSVMVTDETPVDYVTVSVDITHTWVGDLTLKLISPQGTVVQLISQECAQGDNVMATFNDAGAVFSCGDNPAIGGIIIPDVPLSTFNGENPAGEWTLSVFDEFGEDGGALNTWSVQICGTHEAIASVTDATFAGFAVYPNPNNGNFTVRFNPTTTDEVAIMVYDMRGRQVLNKAYTNTGSVFEQTLNLTGAQAGIYLVNVKQGASTITKKIMVK
jgi:subtilisin-like proprotein convertase family protein